MTPLGLSIIVRCALRPGEGIDAPSERITAEVNDFLELGLVTGSIAALRLTRIGQTWLDKLLLTPLPGDSVYLYHGTAQTDLERLDVAARAQTEMLSDAVTTPPKMADIAAMRAAYMANLPNVPPGFEKWAGETIQKPASIAGDQWVEVIHRDGVVNKQNGPKRPPRPDSGAAVQFNWKHRDHDDDIVGWRMGAEPETLHKQHVGTSKAARG